MGHDAWVLGIYLVTGIVDGLVRAVEEGKIEDVTPEEVQAATDARKAMMDRARAPVGDPSRGEGGG